MISPQPDLVVRLVQAEKPADVVHAGAACLAQMLDGVCAGEVEALAGTADGRTP
ncbi:hypothetical protein AB0D59_44585 [Streptomyces sp. NPDC048417]|uniref:hypothetical protein n=1 Tax=Streptomyces sp. NPDC048417 TaxID=3155387 RepID=UPI003438C3A2